MEATLQNREEQLRKLKERLQEHNVSGAKGGNMLHACCALHAFLIYVLFSFACSIIS